MLQCVLTLTTRRHCLIDDADPTVTHGRGTEEESRLATKSLLKETRANGHLMAFYHRP